MGFLGVLIYNKISDLIQLIHHSLMNCLQGGWETDESIKEAASRETLEEAGVRGTVEVSLSNLTHFFHIIFVCK